MTPRHDRRPSRDDFEIVCGVHAGRAVLERRPRDIQRIAFARTVRGELADVLRFANSHRVPCEELPDKALDRMIESTHHEGLVVVTLPRRWTPPKELAEALVTRGGVALALDRVRNPHNVGAILRSAAFFGLEGVLLGTPAPHPGLPAAAVRVAEGGAERLSLSRTTDLADTLARMRTRGVRIIGTDARARAFADRSSFERPLVLVLGNEREGLGDRIRAQCDGLVAIRGAGVVDSLNVAVAAGVLMGFATRESPHAVPHRPITPQ